MHITYVAYMFIIYFLEIYIYSLFYILYLEREAELKVTDTENKIYHIRIIEIFCAYFVVCPEFIRYANKNTNLHI